MYLLCNFVSFQDIYATPRKHGRDGAQRAPLGLQGGGSIRGGAGGHNKKGAKRDSQPPFPRKVLRLLDIGFGNGILYSVTYGRLRGKGGLARIPLCAFLVRRLRRELNRPPGVRVARAGCRPARAFAASLIDILKLTKPHKRYMGRDVSGQTALAELCSTQYCKL